MNWTEGHIKARVTLNESFPHNKIGVINTGVFFGLSIDARENLGVIYNYVASGVVRELHIYPEDYVLHEVE